jgi:AcrR family transcriptional regulator
MWYITAASPRQRLLDAVVDHALDHGIADQSLRAIADAVGTSHRMLIHHFGSKEELFVEVIKAVEARERGALVALHDATDASAEEIGRRFWARLRDPALHAQERLFFEVYGQALQGRPWARPLLDGIVDDWLAPLQALLEAEGADAATARIDARLAVAVARGLLLDLLATGATEAVDAAMARFNAMFAAAIATTPSRSRR